MKYALYYAYNLFTISSTYSFSSEHAYTSRMKRKNHIYIYSYKLILCTRSHIDTRCNRTPKIEYEKHRKPTKQKKCQNNTNNSQHTYLMTFFVWYVHTNTLTTLTKPLHANARWSWKRSNYVSVVTFTCYSVVILNTSQADIKLSNY